MMIKEEEEGQDKFTGQIEHCKEGPLTIKVSLHMSENPKQKMLQENLIGFLRDDP